MKTAITLCNAAAVLLASLSAPLSVAGEAEANYVPYSGKQDLEVLQVDSPTAVSVRFETYPGFKAVFRINLPGVEAPSPNSNSACERQMAADALAATEDFLGDAKAVSMHDMHVHTSTDKDGYADIKTDKGSLRAHLNSAGFLRPADTDPATPWCNDEG